MYGVLHYMYGRKREKGAKKALGVLGPGVGSGINIPLFACSQLLAWFLSVVFFGSMLLHDSCFFRMLSP